MLIWKEEKLWKWTFRICILHALEYASDELKNDKEVVLKAIQNVHMH